VVVAVLWSLALWSISWIGEIGLPPADGAAARWCSVTGQPTGRQERELGEGNGAAEATEAEHEEGGGPSGAKMAAPEVGRRKGTEEEEEGGAQAWTARTRHCTCPPI